MPRVSIILPTYNYAEALPYSIGSVLRQTFTDFELLVIGDGCTDTSESVVASIADARIRWTNLPRNFGHQAAANNEGLRQAKGEIIAYLGHDDLWLPHHLALLTAAIDAGAGLAYGITELVHPNNSHVESAPAWGNYRPDMWIPPTGVVHRRNLTERVGGWGNWRELNCDTETDLWKRIWASGAKIVYVPRLTAVKFPASWRKDIYRTRSCEEQKGWSEYIAREPEIERIELTRLLVNAQDKWALRSLQQLTKEFFREARENIGQLIPAENGELHRKRRKFKGLPAEPPKEK